MYVVVEIRRGIPRQAASLTSAVTAYIYTVWGLAGSRSFSIPGFLMTRLPGTKCNRRSRRERGPALTTVVALVGVIRVRYLGRAESWPLSCTHSATSACG